LPFDIIKTQGQKYHIAQYDQIFSHDVLWKPLKAVGAAKGVFYWIKEIYNG